MEHIFISSLNELIIINGNLISNLHRIIVAVINLLLFYYYLMELIVDEVKHTVLFKSNKVSNLTRREFQLLWKLCQDPGRVYSREQLFEEVWNEKAKPEERTIDELNFKIM